MTEKKGVLFHVYLLSFILTCCTLLCKSSTVCDDPPSFLNAAADLKELKPPFHNGTTVSYLCYYGFVITPNINSTATCIVENETSYWHHEKFSCKRVCPSLPDIPHAELQFDPEVQTLPVVSGTSIKYQCDFGYRSEEPLPNVLCSNGTWELPEEACRPKSCGFPGHVENARSIGHVYTFPNNVTYVCNKGFRLKEGTGTIYCGANGLWTTPLPSCEDVVCPLLPPLEDGKIISSNTKYNSIATYECNRNFHLVGSAQLVCQDNGRWNGSAPTCVATTCLNPGPLENGRVIPQRDIYKAGDVVIFKCFHPRPDEGQHASKCLEDGTWQKRPPLCEGSVTNKGTITEKNAVGENVLDKTTANPTDKAYLSCDDPGDIRNGRRKITGFTPSSNVSYSCENGYELRGQGTLICLSTGKWNLDKLPICVKPIPISLILGVMIGISLVISLGIAGFFYYRWRERKLRGYGKKSKALTVDATDLEEITKLDKEKKPIPVTDL